MPSDRQSRALRRVCTVSLLLFVFWTLCVAAASADADSARQLTDVNDTPEQSTRPLADAGLDREVNRGVTVYLDAGGSYAPAGDINEFEWTIERPNGSFTSPDCSTCEQTTFVPAQVGTYNVSLNVTASNGATASDYLYVHVGDRPAPTANLTGPPTLLPGKSGSYALTVSPASEPLLSASWRIDGEPHASGFLEEDDILNQTLSFDLPGEYRVRGTVRDESGASGGDTLNVTVGDEYSDFDVSITDVGEPPTPDAQLVVTAVVENQGTESDTQPIVLENSAGDVGAYRNGVSLDPGENTSVTLTSDACMVDSGTILVRSQDSRDTASVNPMAEDCSSGQLELQSVDAPSRVREGERVEVSATVRNTGQATTTQHVTLEDIYGRTPDGGIADVTLPPDGETVVTLSWNTSRGDAGTGTIDVFTKDDHARQPFEVLPAAFFEVEITDIDGPSSLDSPSVTVASRITNTGEYSETQSIRLVNGDTGRTIDTVDAVSLESGEQSTISHSWSLNNDPNGSELQVRSEDDSDSRIYVSDVYGGFGSNADHTIEFAEIPASIEPGDEFYIGTNWRTYSYDLLYNEAGEVIDVGDPAFESMVEDANAEHWQYNGNGWNNAEPYMLEGKEGTFSTPEEHTNDLWVCITGQSAYEYSVTHRGPDSEENGRAKDDELITNCESIRNEGYEEPTARISAPSSVDVGESVTFDGSYSNSDAGIAEYKWEVDKNCWYCSNEIHYGNTISTSFGAESAGKVDIKLIITDELGQTTSTIKTVQVNGDLDAYFTISQNPIPTESTIKFNAGGSGADAGIAKYEWDTDGSGLYDSSTSQPWNYEVYHYRDTGIIPIKLKITDKMGNTDVYSKTVFVSDESGGGNDKNGDGGDSDHSAGGGDDGDQDDKPRCNRNFCPY